MELAAVNAARDDDLQRAIGRLEAGHEHIDDQLKDIKDLLERSGREAGDYRQKIRDQLTDLDRKVDPIVIKVDAVERQIMTHEIVLKSYADRDQQIKGAAWLGRGIIYVAWLAFGGALMAAWRKVFG